MLPLPEIPGSSVFRGENDIYIDNSAPKEEEEEFLEEERNRQAELQNVVATAFGDLEDDDSSISSHFDSSHNLQSGLSNERIEPCNDESESEINETLDRHSFTGEKNANIFVARVSEEHSASPGSTVEASNSRRDYILNKNEVDDFGNDSEAYKLADVNSAAQLQILLGIRMKENARLRSDIAIAKESNNQVLRKLTISENENQQNQSLVADLKTLYSDCLDKLKSSNEEVSRLREELMRTTQHKSELTHELDLAKQQIVLMEKCGSLKNQDKHIESVVERLKEMHKREMNVLQKELDEAMMKISQKEASYQLLENKMAEMEERRAAMLINKCDSTAKQEAAVKAMLDEAHLQNVQLTKNILHLEAENKSLKKDLEFHENVTANRLLSSTSSDEQEFDVRSPSFARHCAERKSLNNVDVLKAELNRALIGQKDKRLEIRKLHEQIRIKEVQITQMREQEKAHYTETEELKANMATLLQRFEESADKNEKLQLTDKIDRLEQLISVLSREKNELADRTKELEIELDNSKRKLDEQKNESLKVAQEYVVFHEQEMERLKRENEDLCETMKREWRNRLQRISNDSDEIKKLYLEMRADRDLAAEKLEEERQKIIESTKVNKILEERIKNLKRQVSDLEDHIISLQEEHDEKNAVNGQSEEKKANGLFMKRLKNEVELLRRQTIDLTKYEQLRDEVSASKQRYRNLEFTLKTDFETNVIELKKENDNLKAELQKYTDRVNAFCCVATQTIEINPKTIDVDSIGSEGIEKLRDEIERLRKLEENRSKEIVELKTTFQIRLQEKLEELEPKLVHQSYCETEAIKEEVKKITSQFYLAEIDKLRFTHKSEIEEIQSQKEEQSQKIIHLETELQSKQSKVEAIEELKAQLIAQQNVVQEVKNKSSLIIRNCAKEYEDLKMAKKKLEEQLEVLSLKTEKYKQSAFKYKKLFEKIKTNDLPQRYQKLVALVESKELEIVNKIQEVSKAFEAQQKSPA